MEWTDEVIARLRQLWAEGHSTAEIGRRIGVTKNAVVGKVHRLQLIARPSPIRRDGPAARPPRRPAGPRRVIGPTLPSMAAITPPPRPVMPPPHQRPHENPSDAPQAAEPIPPVASRPPPDLRPVSPVRAVPASRLSSRLVTCCWPIGEPGTPTFRFCDADALFGKPYCGEHAQLAYVKVRDRREEVA
jgi:GcrA cell cycle regulator